MDDVIDTCQVTFEEDGINQQTLNDLRTVGLAFSSPSAVAQLWIENLAHSCFVNGDIICID